MKVDLKVDVREALKVLEEDQKEMRFVLAKSLTRTAKAAQAAVQQHMPSAFTIRNRRVVEGIRITPAQKSQQEPFATVGSIDNFMALQETGGDKTPEKGARSLAVPDAEDIGPVIRRSATGKITAGTRPAALLAKASHGGATGRKPKGKKTSFKARYFVARPAKGRPFIAMTEKGSVPGKARQSAKATKGRRRKRVKFRRVARRKLNMIYALPKRAKILPRLKLYEIVEKVAERVLEDEVLKALKESLDEGAKPTEVWSQEPA